VIQTSTEPVIEIQALLKRFGKEVVLQGIDLSIEPGQVVGLIGTNGSGKTTLIKCLLGLLRKSGGCSKVFGVDSWDLAEMQKSRLGYVSQEFAILPWMKVEAMCDYTGAFYEKWDYQWVQHLLKEWNLNGNKRVGALSVGQRQKLAVILAMGHRPELLILDEPVSSLDPVARRQFLQSLIEFTEQDKNTILFSTHITSDLERVASHLAMLKQGRIAYFGELESLKDRCKRLRIFSEQPLPQDFAIPEAIHCEINGNHARAAIPNFNDETVSQISSRWDVQVQVEDLNLEEIFLELNGVSSETNDAEAN